MQCLGSLLKSLDNFGDAVEFNFGRRPRFQTVCGGVMRIIAHFIVGIVGYRLLLVKFIELEPRQELSYSYS